MTASAFAQDLCASIFGFWNVLGIAVVLLYLYWWRRPHPKYPPGPRGLPLVGVLPFVGRYPAEVFKKWSLEKYGPVMSVRLGRQDVVVLNTFEAVNQALVKQSVVFSDRPRMALFCSLTGQTGIFGVRQFSDHFKTMKQFGLKFLKEKGASRAKMDEIINEEGDSFVEFIKRRGGTPFDIKKYMYGVSSNITSKFTLGKRHDYDEPKFKKLIEAVSTMFADSKTIFRINMIHQCAFLAKIPWFKQAMDKFEMRMQTLIDYCKESIQEHKARFDPSSVNDFVDSFLYEAKLGKANTRQLFTDDQLVTYSRDMLLGGTETSSMTLSWCLVCYLNYPKEGQIVDAEIHQVLGESGTPLMSKRDRMPYTCAFLHEVARYRTFAPLALLHATAKTCELMGYVIPKGVMVIPNLQGVHTDPETWPKPDVFDPTRHIDENGKFVHSNKIIPFSIGGRYCLGESIGRAEVFLIFVKLIQHFKLQPADGLPPLDNGFASAALSPQECMVYAEPRHYGI